MSQKNPRLGFFDLETKALLRQQSEWQCAPCKSCGQLPVRSEGGIIVEGNEQNLYSLPMSVGAVRDTRKAETYVYEEDEAHELVKHLHKFDLIVGYNIRAFDYIVLEKYGGSMLKFLPTFDMFAEIKRKTDKMIGLGNIVKKTLGLEITKLGAQAVNTWWYGDKQEVIDYCKLDVEISQKIFGYACLNKHLKYWDWDERDVVEIDTSYWADKARLIVQSEVPEIKCPELTFPEIIQEDDIPDEIVKLESIDLNAETARLIFGE